MKKLLSIPIKHLRNPVLSFKRTQEDEQHNNKILFTFNGDLGKYNKQNFNREAHWAMAYSYGTFPVSKHYSDILSTKNAHRISYRKGIDIIYHQ